VGDALVRLDHSITHVKIWGCSTPKGLKYGIPKKAPLVDTISHRDLQGYWTEVLPDLFLLMWEKSR